MLNSELLFMDIIVGTAGHIDHGKTALVKALTGVDADRFPEEKLRGITIDIGFAELDLGDVRVGFVDVPGHEKFVKNMLAGASGIDVVLLVIEINMISPIVEEIGPRTGGRTSAGRRTWPSFSVTSWRAR